MKRRSFFKTTGAVISPLVIPASVLGREEKTAPSERVTIGLVGAGGKGTDLMRDFYSRCKDEVQFVAIADPDVKHAERGKQLAEKYWGQGCKTYKDFRELCDRDDLDAVVVATPDHWHAIAALEAIRKGKDVYGEKPLTHLFREGKVLYEEVKKHKRIYQVGSEQRSSVYFRIAAEVILNGLVGKIQEVQVGLPGGETTEEEGKVAQPIPDHLDYDFWCGPSPKLPYHKDRVHFHWRWSLAYGGGSLMDWIGHHNDIAHWGLGVELSGPIRVEAKNFRYPEKGMYNNPVDYEVRSEYEGGYTVVISNKYGGGVRWIGEDGWVRVSRGQIEASNKDWIREKTDRGMIKAYNSPDHRRNFVAGVKTRKECICPAEIGHRSVTPGHLSFVSDTLKRPLKWDPKNETILDDQEADKLLNKLDYRGDWAL